MQRKTFLAGFIAAIAGMVGSVSRAAGESKSAPQIGESTPHSGGGQGEAPRIVFGDDYAGGVTPLQPGVTVIRSPACGETWLSPTEKEQINQELAPLGVSLRIVRDMVFVHYTPVAPTHSPHTADSGDVVPGRVHDDGQVVFDRPIRNGDTVVASWNMPL